MAKKLTLPFAALAVVLALVLPATAAAEDVLLPVGSWIKISSTAGMTISSELLGNVSCKEMTWEGELTENGGKLLIPGMKGSGKECSNGKKVVVMNETTLTTKIAEGEVEHGTTQLGFKATVGALACEWVGTGIAFTYTKGTDTGAFTAAAGITGKPTSCGNATLTMATTDQYLTEEGWKPVKWL